MLMVMMVISIPSASVNVSSINKTKYFPEHIPPAHVDIRTARSEKVEIYVEIIEFHFLLPCGAMS